MASVVASIRLVWLRRAAEAFRPELAALVAAAVAASAELQERTALKQVGIAAAMAGALVDRGAAEPVARLAAEIGALALKQGCREEGGGC